MSNFEFKVITHKSRRDHGLDSQKTTVSETKVVFHVSSKRVNESFKYTSRYIKLI